MPTVVAMRWRLAHLQPEEVSLSKDPSRHALKFISPSAPFSGNFPDKTVGMEADLPGGYGTALRTGP